MSQYPYPPQNPWQLPYAGPVAMRLQNKVALVQMVFAALLLFCGSVLLLGAITAPPGEIERSFVSQGVVIPASNLPPGYTVLDLITLTLKVCGVLTLAAGLLLLGFAIFIRRGSAVAVVASLILNSMLAAFLGLNVLVNITRSPFSALLAAMTLCLVGWLIVALSKARRSLSSAPDPTAAYQAQYWAYMQQYYAAAGQPYPQGSAGAGYGGGYGSGGYGGNNAGGASAPALAPGYGYQTPAGAAPVATNQPATISPPGPARADVPLPPSSEEKRSPTDQNHSV